MIVAAIIWPFAIVTIAALIWVLLGIARLCKKEKSGPFLG